MPRREQRDPPKSVILDEATKLDAAIFEVAEAADALDRVLKVLRGDGKQVKADKIGITVKVEEAFARLHRARAVLAELKAKVVP